MPVTVPSNQIMQLSDNYAANSMSKRWA